MAKSPTTSERVSILNSDLRFRNLTTRKSLLWIGGSLLLILLFVIVVAYLLDEPLRRKIERDLNHRLKGYTVRIGRLDFHPSASVHWKALLRGRFVADFELDNPTVRFDLTQFSQEARDETPIKEKGW